MQTHSGITPCINATAVITRPIRTVHHSGAKRELIRLEREAVGMEGGRDGGTEGGGQNCKMDKEKGKKTCIISVKQNITLSMMLQA